jgi:hypothetical protein
MDQEGNREDRPSPTDQPEREADESAAKKMAKTSAKPSIDVSALNNSANRAFEHIRAQGRTKFGHPRDEAETAGREAA